MLTIAYIGNGKSTNRYHLPFVFQRKELFKVKWIYERRLNESAWRYYEDIQYSDNLEMILKDPEVDLVVVCTGHDSHFDYAKKILESGKHCLVEKPFMETSQQAKEIFNFAKDKGLIIQAFQNRRFDSDFLTVQKVIESGKLGDLLEVEMHWDYYRPEVPESVYSFKVAYSYLYGHGCHTIDQVLSYFGKPDHIHYDVRQLLGPGRMNDYFDIDFYYGIVKVSVKSSYFRVKERPSFVVFGKKGCFEKATIDRQETHLKEGRFPGEKDFGKDSPEQYGCLTTIDENQQINKEKIVSEIGDYGRVYDDLYQVIVNGQEKQIRDEETILQMEILEKGVENLK